MSKNTTWDGKTDLQISVKIANLDKIVENTAKRCETWLHANSPEGRRKNGSYREGWTIRKGTKKDDESFYEVWNKTNYQLTHLLENGHIIANKKGGVGWASARPHIQKSVEYVEPQFLAEMEKADVDVDFTKG